uniref:EGF-like domain-containing protein n=1 Tax=Parastrongyloides trichosuri TaxID=131310 RepID=A0A0N4ZQS6_PARTI
MILLGNTYNFVVIFGFLSLISYNRADNEDLKLIKEFSKKWDLSKEITIDDNIFKILPKKFDTAQPIKGGFGCQEPGYTGQHCEFPICDNPNIEHEHNDAVSVLVDFRLLTSCDKMIPLYVDISMFSFTIEVHAPGNFQPMINVYDSNATLIQPFNIDISDPSKALVTYQTQNPGVYQVIPSSDSPQLGCYIYISSIAQSHVDVGFVPHSENDIIAPERNDYPNSNPFLNQVNTIVAHSINIRQPGAISTFSIYQEYNIMSRPQTASIRYGCEFDYYFSGFYCYKEDYYFMKIEGYDYFGNSFSRIKSFSCTVNPNQPITPTSTPSNPTSCQNNGTLITNSDNSSYCYCQNLFTSYDCSSLLCINGGTSLPDGSCMCKDGYSGPNCQDIKCTSDSGYLPPQNKNVPIFVLRMRQNMNSIIQQVSNVVTQIAKDLIDHQPEWYQNFGVIVFNNDGSTFSSQLFTSVEGLQSFLSTVSSSNDVTGNCTDIVFSAITSALETFTPGNRSPVYIFTDAMPSDLPYYDNIAQQNSYYQAPLYFFLIQTSTCQSNQAWDQHSPESKSIESLTERFSGFVIPITPDMQNTVVNVFYNFVSNTYFKTELMYGNDLDICVNMERYNTLAIDSQFHKIAIVARGTNISLQLTTPEGNTVLPNQLTASSINIWTYTGLEIGQWQFNIIPGDVISSCSIRVYAVVTPDAASFAPHFKVNWGFTNNIIMDSPVRQPLARMENSFVASIDNYMLRDPTRVNAEVIIHSKTGFGKNMTFASNGIWRDGCIFHFYFASFICRTSDENLYFTLFVRDQNDFYIQRAGSMYCAEFHPTPSPPDSCSNGGFKLNGTCICPPTYTGSNCQTAICQNGGTPYRDGCTCPPLIQGYFCEILACAMSSGTPGPFNKQKSLVFLLDLTYTNNLFLRQLSTYSNVMIRDILSHDRQGQYTIVVYGYNEQSFPTILGITDTSNLELFSDFINDGYQQSLAASQSCVKTQTWKALDMARMISDPHSQIFLFQSSIPDEDTEISLEYYTNIYELYINNGLSLTSYIGAIGKKQYYCSGISSSFSLLQSLSEQTYQGDYLEVSQSSYMNVPKVIPTFVSSGIAYKKDFTDCKGSCFLFFSVDSHTQNIQIKVKGNVGGYQTMLQLPNQTVASTSYSLIDDTLTGLQILEARRECESGYESLGPQYCIKYVSTPKNWIDAHNDCLNDDGYLVDDLYPSKDSYLTQYQNNHNASSIWIGLHSNEATSLGIWMWDRGSLSSVPLSSSHYTNWNVNADLKNTAKQCAYKTSDWNTDTCTALRPYICQKHKFQDTYDPSISEFGRLPGGKWFLLVNSTGSVSVEVRVQSRIQIHSGFLTDIHGDDVSINANLLSTDLRMATHITLINHNMFNTYLAMSQLFTTDNVMFDAVIYQPRESCSYQYLSQTLTCPQNNKASTNFYALTTGVDEYGFTIERYTAHKCVKEIPSCGDNGVVYNGKCYCSEYWSGTFCEIPLCVNNGIFNNATNTCTCPIGYTGPACERAMCLNNSGKTISRDGKAFVLVIENTQENLVAINSLKANISQTLRSVSNTWFSEYIYVLFDSVNPPTFQRFFSIDTYITSFQQIVPQDDTTSCSLPVYKALTMALQQIDQSQSLVYTITRSVPSDVDQELTFGTSLVQYSPQFFYHTISGDSGCTTDMTNSVLQRLQQYAIGSGGNVLTTTGSKIGEAFGNIIPSLYYGTPLSNPTMSNNTCTGGITSYVHVDKDMTDLYFYIYGSYPSITVLSPLNEPIIPQTIFSGQAGITPRLYIFRVSLITEYGVYTIKTTSSGTCYAQIRGTGSSEIYYGFVPTIANKLDLGNHLDNTTSVPLNDYNQIVGTVIGDRAKLYYVELYNTDNFESQFLKFYRRDNCTYNYYSDPFKCTNGKILLRFYAQDNSGYTLVRESMTMCVQYVLPTPSITTTPSSQGISTTTQNSQGISTTSKSILSTKANIYLITDNSLSVPAGTYGTVLTTFLMNFFKNFNINLEYVNVAFSPSPGDQNMWLTLPTFNTYNGYTSLQSSINTSYYPIEGFQSAGQSQLSEIIKMAINPNFIASGYSDSYKPHILLYLTTTSSPDSNALSQSSEVRQSGKFKIISIAYQASNNIDSLQSMSDCIYKAESVDDLNALASALATRVNSASQNGIEYQC